MPKRSIGLVIGFGPEAATLDSSEAVAAGSTIAVNTPVRFVAKSLTTAARGPFAVAEIRRMTSFAAILVRYTSAEQRAAGSELQLSSYCEHRRMNASVSTASRLTEYLPATGTQSFAEAVLQVELEAIPGKGLVED